jgi:methionyl-tRNA synthetase
MIPFDDFQKVEIKAGAIRSAEKIEGSDKLLRLMVDFGEAELRQIVSGIAPHFPDSESLVGEVCAFVTNLEPRDIRGVSSNGMILAAGVPGESFSLLRISRDIPPGTRVK